MRPRSTRGFQTNTGELHAAACGADARGAVEHAGHGTDRHPGFLGNRANVWHTFSGNQIALPIILMHKYTTSPGRLQTVSETVTRRVQADQGVQKMPDTSISAWLLRDRP